MAQPEAQAMGGILGWIERMGNKVPHPVMIFVYLLLFVVVLSAILSAMGASVSYQVWDARTDSIIDTTTTARSLLTIDGIRFMFTGVVANFMGFQAVGVIIVAMVGVGVAEEAGLVKALIHRLVAVSPRSMLTYILTFVGIISSIAADAGYLVLIPLAAAAFQSIGRHPLAGLAVGFASVASAFLVNILIVPIDGILVGITNDAIALVDPARKIGLTSNFWFSVGSTLLLTVVIGLITEFIITPKLGAYAGPYDIEKTGANEGALGEARGLRYAGYAFLGVIAFIALLVLPPGAPLRHPTTGAIIENSPFMNSLIVSIAVIFMATGIAYGKGAGTLQGSTAVIGAIVKAIGSLAGLILLLLVISQFLAFFNYSNMATLAAISLADILKEANLDAIWLLVGFVVVVLLLDVVITGAVPKWALFAPVFVPLLMRLDVPPEAVLAAYRVGDSPMNAITPLNAYFAMIVTFAQRYQKDAGVGTVIALMLPYVGIMTAVWVAFMVGWHLLGLPWGV